MVYKMMDRGREWDPVKGWRIHMRLGGFVRWVHLTEECQQRMESGIRALFADPVYVDKMLRNMVEETTEAVPEKRIFEMLVIQIGWAVWHGLGEE
jgi:hypothetical protein